ncbi:MAG: 2,3-bisphosphoglycerate-independent phosphoglycerate mutase [Clostridia bacterium]|nr:2,3-bisphosphoglycerate-independent phosphoglycerate mutase [Clostridia bacterium]
MNTKPVVLIIMDGYGLASAEYGNAITKANVGVIENLKNNYPYTTLGASGMDVGLPDGQMGNSEVGHLNMGAGRIVYQDLTRITKEIQDGDFFKNEELNLAIDNALKNDKKLHLYGLLSTGGVHSHITHLFALLKLCKEKGLEKVFVHCFLDGRDVAPTSGADFIKDLQTEINAIGVGKIASVCGRYYAMDRDNRWDRVEKAYDMLTIGSGEKAVCAETAVRESYLSGVTDEFVLPTNVVDNAGKPVGLIEKGDSIIFFNFRPDRAREITRAFTVEDFDGFERKTGYLAPCYVGFSTYDATFENVKVAFKKIKLTNTLGKFLSDKGYTQLRIAETEKYAHVTFFFNGGIEAPEKNEQRDLIASPKVATYDLQPEMSAPEVTAKVLEEIETDKFDVIILNYANCDMVGHTGVQSAAIKAVTTVENSVQAVVDKVLSKGGSVLITADHGNADRMFEDELGAKPFTAHTTNPVPFILVSNLYKGAKLRNGGCLADIAPTMLEIMGEEKPVEMTGISLIESK